MWDLKIFEENWLFFYFDMDSKLRTLGALDGTGFAQDLAM